MKVILIKNQERSKRDKKRVRIRKSGCVELNETCCYTKKFNVSLRLCEVLEVAFYFSKSYLRTAAKTP